MVRETVQVQQRMQQVVPTDLHMPKMSGYDMVEKIREEAALLEAIDAQPYIIAVTANALKGERERCLAVGINDFITKPIELNALEDILNQWSDLDNKQPKQISSNSFRRKTINQSWSY